MAKRIDNTNAVVTFTFDGQTVSAREGDTVAAALVAADRRALRESVVSGAPRGVYCMMGACFDCLVEIEGVANRQSCMVTVQEGMVVRRQRVCSQGKQ
ncbi:(2Fe-2S)-binding protein [Affinibrenneria salicis]|uniref:(2Fe-2S)-binding protein n=2 Tax=Affinibrenneria salicis TaxID=2590031 RepID=A0A5J5G433_9GAMM|nr:(2Fe-2S)-binding protein [Affinibrenneria salicis]